MKAVAILSIPLPADLYQLVVSASSNTRLSRTEVMRQSIRIGLPQLVKALTQSQPVKTSTAKQPRTRRTAAN
jgi:hypothetical protein